jgi:hypothetical protein
MADIKCTSRKPWDRKVRPTGDGKIICVDQLTVRDDGVRVTTECPNCGNQITEQQNPE